MKTAKTILGCTMFTVVLAMQLTHCDVQNGHDIQSASTETIRPFTVNFSDAALKDLRKRILKTKWPKKETVANQSQDVQQATMQKTANYWATAYDSRKVEAKLNVIPQFITNIDSLDLQFIRVKSHHPNASPLTFTHARSNH